ncbi:MAG: hypothetical protein QT10_C0001G0057 [archaeon GW2011_AR19]|nr:MAG: hypothetical protein QT10_C0001G0057 [archaeon GW2011_AR19]
MLPKYHIILGFFFSLILFLIFPFIGLLGFLIIFVSSVLIDADIYLYYVFTKKNFNLINAMKYYSKKRKEVLLLPMEQRAKKQGNIRIFHGIEVLLILFLLGFFINKIFLFIFIGFSFHLFLDIVEQIHYGFRISKISLIFDFVKKINEKS